MLKRLGQSTAASPSLEELFLAHGDRLIRRLALIVGDAEEARDIAQQTFLRAVEHGPLSGGLEADRWLTVVGVRLALNERRRRRLWGFLAVRDDDATWAIQSNPDIWRGLMSLRPSVRAALVLTVLEGYTQDEVAKALGVSRGTVASSLSRARERLRPLLEERVQ